MQPEEKGWIIKTKRRKRMIPARATSNCREEKYNTRTSPTRRFWLGFDKEGNERWFIELSNGKIIASTDESYNYWLKKYIYKEA